MSCRSLLVYFLASEVGPGSKTHATRMNKSLASRDRIAGEGYPSGTRQANLFKCQFSDTDLVVPASTS
jgi:hypothetical protein